MTLPSKIKDHVSRHKTVYTVGSYVVVAGVVYVVAKGVKVQGGIANTSVSVNPVSLFSNRMTTNVMTIIDRGTQGPPSYLVQCLETGEIWISQRAAAFANGVSQTDLSLHLNGIKDSVNNLHFERVGIAI